MMGSKKRDFAPPIPLSLEELVPVDHFYRHLERSLDLSQAVEKLFCRAQQEEKMSSFLLTGRTQPTDSINP